VSFVLLLSVLAVLGGVALVAAGRGSAMPDVEPDRAPLGVLPPDAVGPPEVERLRFSLAFRGYRMDEVDDVLDRLTAELVERDARIAELENPTDRAEPAVPVLPAEPVQPTTAIRPTDHVQASEPARPPEG
jgi:DivIVA domain-containing protein